jgi:hypothetical protein
MKSMRVTASGRASAAAACLAAATAGLLAGCGSAPAPAALVTPTVTVTPGAPASAKPSPTSVAVCSTSQLAVALGSGGAAAGSSYYPLDFTNTSGSSCTLYGYPGVSFVTASGAQVGTAATENPVYPRQLVVIAPGKTAHALLRVTAAVNYPPSMCKPVTVNRLKIYPPGDTSAMYLNLKFSATGCKNAKIFVLGIDVVQPGASAH